jgi:hypothetical protein
MVEGPEDRSYDDENGHHANILIKIMERKPFQ